MLQHGIGNSFEPVAVKEERMAVARNLAKVKVKQNVK